MDLEKGGPERNLKGRAHRKEKDNSIFLKMLQFFRYNTYGTASSPES